MHRVSLLMCLDRRVRGRLMLVWLVAALMGAGCHREPEIEFITATKPPTVRLVHPLARKLVRVVGQPSFIESYERTSIYPKPTAYIQDWVVDIGDKVQKVDVLARLFAELVEELGSKRRPSCSTASGSRWPER